MEKYAKNDKTDGIQVSKLIINYINSLLVSRNQKTIILEFMILENNLFLITEFKEGANNVITSKTKLNIDIENISFLYEQLYELIKNIYVESNSLKILIGKQISFSNPDYPYLNICIHDIHQNEVNLRLRNLIMEKEVLQDIEKDAINLYKEKRSSKIK